MKHRLENNSGAGPDDAEAMCVLVVDDEPIIRELLQAMLGNMKVSVEIAENGIQAQHKILSGSYHLVITDINMPEMDGITFLRWLKKKQPDIDIVVMTGYDLTEEMLQVIGDKAIDYFVKPPEREKVFNAVQYCREKLRLKEQV
jgi:two-component system, NtrC family, response regulator AtoC